MNPALRHEFLPAIGPYVTERRDSWRYPIHWYDKKIPEIYYPYGLVSHALWRDSMPYSFDQEGVTLFGDSGGYTVVTQPDYKTSPTDVIRWQLAYCTRGVMLDIPPYRKGSAIQFSGSAAEWWEPSLALSVQNVKRALHIYKAYRDSVEMKAPGRETEGFKWWGVVQGEEWDQMSEWHAKISEVYPFNAVGEGWALAPKPSTDLLSCTRYMRFAHEKNLRNVHLLQVTADRTVALILALAVLSGRIDLVTYDSASALRCAINRSAIIPDGFGQKYIKESRKIQVDADCPACLKIGTECQCRGNENMVHEMMMACACRACQWYREFYPHSNSEYPHIILLHNHLTMVRSFELTFAECQSDPDRVIRWAAENRYGEIMREWEGHTQSKPQRRPVSLFDRIK